MADNTRRLDDLGRTLFELRARLDSLETTALGRIATHTHAPFVMGTVDPAWTTGKPKVTVDGTAGLTAAGVDALASYTPAAGDRVLIAAVAGSLVILGEVV